MFTSQLAAVVLALPPLFRLSTALWIPEKLENDAAFWMPEDFIAKRQESCNGDSSVLPCGSGFPSDFCCDAGSQCISLNTSSSITAAFCCPLGDNCSRIKPIQCNQALQNATAYPSSQLHSNPPTSLQTCGKMCCPMGYSCQDDICVGMAAAQASSSSTSTTTAASSTLATSSSTLTTSTFAPSVTTSSTAAAPIPLTENATEVTSHNEFSGKSFAAGFVPGIALGALIAGAIIFWFLGKDRKRRSSSHANEKLQFSRSRDTLTDLSPEVHKSAAVHGRSISEPTANLNFGHRTEFLNSPPRNDASGSQGYLQGYAVRVHGPATPGSQKAYEAPRSTGWLSRSPFVNQVQTPVPTQSPLPSHMKRGTISGTIKPVRDLKRQRSMHSLRRQITSATNRSNSSRRRTPGVSRSGSRETIKVGMATPEQSGIPRIPSEALSSAAYKPQIAQQKDRHLSRTGTWDTIGTSDNTTPIEELPNTYTPTRPGRNSDIQRVGERLQPPYTPSCYPSDTDGMQSRSRLSSLMPPGLRPDRPWRDTTMTTFSGMMQKAGLRRTLLMGPDPRDWNK